MNRNIFIIACLLVVSCASPETAKRRLELDGFTNIAIGEYDYFSCGSGYLRGVKFSALNRDKRNVYGVVCTTIRDVSVIKY